MLVDEAVGEGEEECGQLERAGMFYGRSPDGPPSLVATVTEWLVFLSLKYLELVKATDL